MRIECDDVRRSDKTFIQNDRNRKWFWSINANICKSRRLNIEIFDICDQSDWSSDSTKSLYDEKVSCFLFSTSQRAFESENHIKQKELSIYSVHDVRNVATYDWKNVVRNRTERFCTFSAIQLSSLRKHFEKKFFFEYDTACEIKSNSNKWSRSNWRYYVVKSMRNEMRIRYKKR